MRKSLKLRNLAMIACLIISILFVGCDKEKENKEELFPINIGEDVYIVGCEFNARGGGVAKLWNGKDIENLTGGTYGAEAVSVYVSGNDVYIAGYEGRSFDNRNIEYIAKLWKNGIGQDLTDGTNFAKASSVFISGNDVYVVGYEGQFAKLWKNGIGQNLTDGTNMDVTGASSVYVSGSDVYVVGREGRFAKLWKNGVGQNLTDGISPATASSVYVSGNDVYVSGIDWYVYIDESGAQTANRVAKLWKNGVVQDLTDGTYDAAAWSVFVSGNDVYVTGYEGQFAKLWKNGVGQNLTDGTNMAIASSVYVSGNDVYVAGYEKVSSQRYIVKLWKNGKIQKLPGTGDGLAYGVFVK